MSQLLRDLSALLEEAQMTPRDAVEAALARLIPVFAETGISLDAALLTEVLEFRDLLGRESDRGCALLASAKLEAALGDVLRAHMVDDKEAIQSLLGSMQPLGTFSARIEACYAFGFIGALVRRDLHLMRKIRNEFAHGRMDTSFEDAPIAARCRELHHDMFRDELPPRKKFMRVTMGVLATAYAATKEVTKPPVAKDVDLDSTTSRELAENLASRLTDSTRKTR